MANLTNQKQNGVKIYDIITPQAEKKIIELSRKLNVDKLVYEKHNHYSIIFYDTPDNLLTKTGILLYRTIENDLHFLKMEKLSFLPSVSRLRKNELFELEIAPKDTPKSQAFYLINGITAMFSTRFQIDLENVIKAVIPQLEIDIKGSCYKGFSGDGFKCLIEFQNVKYKNNITKRNFKNKECTVTNISSSKNLVNDFEKFIKNLEKYCKDILPQTTSRYDYGMRLTRIDKKEMRKKEKEKKKEKKNSADHKIEG